jgi:dihydroorotate dehydrogenase
VYRTIVRPLLFKVPPEPAHEFTIQALSLFERAPKAATLARRRLAAQRPTLKTTVCGIEFPNPLGLAAGLDKNGEAIIGLFALGFGFLELGTVTPRPQPGNPLPRMFRLPEHQAVINRMGFNNEGMDAMAQRLTHLPWRPAPIGINIGKNKDTPLESAVDDYVACAAKLGKLSDYVAVNLSSPNTPGLRQLQEPRLLEAILLGTRRAIGARPMFLKIAPDLTDEAIDAVVDVARSSSCDGLICTNTTIERPFSHPLAGESGGLSGRPLFDRSTKVLRRVYKRSKGQLPLIGVGGIMDADDAWEKICAGASLVQIYTGFIYGGPRLPWRLLNSLDRKVQSLGLTSIAEAVGRDN